MSNKKAKISETHADTPLVGAARSIGSTLGTVAAKAEETAKDIEVFTQSVRKDAASTTNKIYKRAKKGIRVGAATWKAGAKKRKASKTRARKSSGRRK
jgi:tRNA A-37 threonylcarbamoyl transferase component Bud32